MGVGAVSFFKIRFGIVNPDLVRKQIADRVEEVGEVVDEQRRVAAEAEKARRQAQAHEMLEAASRVAAAKRAAKALRLRREQELQTRLFWLWRAWADKRIFLKRERAATVFNRICRKRLAEHVMAKRREDVALMRYLLEQKSALKVQCWIRGVWGRRKAREKRRIETWAALRIQSTFRANVVRAWVIEYRRARTAAVTVCAKVYRGRAARIVVQRVRVVGWANTIAQVSKLWFGRRRLRASLRRRACVRIQTAWRASRARVLWQYTRVLMSKHRASVYISKMYRGYYYRSRRHERAVQDVAAIEGMLMETGLRRWVPRMREWGGGTTPASRTSLTLDLLLQVNNQQQLGGEWWSRQEQWFWGISDLGERARFLETIQAHRAKRKSKLKRERRAAKAGATWKNSEVARLGTQAFEGVLADAALVGDVETVTQMLAVRRDGGPVDLECRNGKGRTAYHASVAGGHMEVVKLLVAAGAQLDTRDESGASPFTSACAAGLFPTMIRYLTEELHADTDVVESGDAGNSGFGHAVWGANLKLVEHYVEVFGGAAVDPDILLGSEVYGRVTPFFAACAVGHSGMARYLYRCGFDTMRPTDDGVTPRQIAVRNRHSSVVRMIDSIAVDPSSPGGTAATTAAVTAAASPTATSSPQQPQQSFDTGAVRQTRSAGSLGRLGLGSLARELDMDMDSTTRPAERSVESAAGSAEWLDQTAAVVDQQQKELLRAQRNVRRMAARVKAATADNYSYRNEGWGATSSASSASVAIPAPATQSRLHSELDSTSTGTAAKILIRDSSLAPPTSPVRSPSRMMSPQSSPYFPPLATALPQDDPYIDPPPELAAMLERCANQRPRYFIDAVHGGHAKPVNGR